MVEALLTVLIVLNVLGGYGVIRWLKSQILALRGAVSALEATVKAQAATLETLGGLNEIALEVIKALDPKRWAEEVRIHKQLADEKVKAIVEQERRKLQGLTTEVVAYATSQTVGYMSAALRFIAHVPKGQRAELIRSLEAPEEIKQRLADFGAQAPDLSLGFRRLLNLSDFAPAASAEGVVVEKAPVPPNP